MKSLKNFFKRQKSTKITNSKIEENNVIKRFKKQVNNKAENPKSIQQISDKTTTEKENMKENNLKLELLLNFLFK